MLPSEIPFMSIAIRLKITLRVPLYDKPLNLIKPVPPGIMPNTVLLTHLQSPLTSRAKIKHLNLHTAISKNRKLLKYCINIL